MRYATDTAAEEFTVYDLNRKPVCACTQSFKCAACIAQDRETDGDPFADFDFHEARLLLIECRNELWRWGQVSTGQVLIGPDDTQSALAHVRKIESFLDLPQTARRS
jgi:hypothetical protein